VAVLWCLIDYYSCIGIPGPPPPCLLCLPLGVVYAAKPRAEVLGVARLIDTKNRLEAVISFGPVPGTRQRRLARADAVCGEIYQLPKAAHLHVSDMEGCSLSEAL